MRSRRRSSRGCSGSEPTTGPRMPERFREIEPRARTFLEASAPAVALRPRRKDIAVALFSAIAGLGTSLEVHVQALRAQLFFPADARSRECSSR